MKTPMTIKVIVLAITVAFPLLVEAQARFVPGHTLLIELLTPVLPIRVWANSVMMAELGVHRLDELPWRNL